MGARVVGTRVHWLPYLTLGALCALCANPGPSIAHITFETTYGGPFWDWGNSVQQTSDGGYVIGGLTESFGAGMNDLYLIKTDSFGNLEWDTTYGGPLDDWGYAVQQVPDGGYMIAGFTTVSATNQDVYLVKTDSLGNVQWDGTYGDTSYEEGLSAEQTADGGYIITGVYPGPTSWDIYLVKTDSLGNLQWDTTYGDTSEDVGSFVEQTSDGGYIIAGYTESFGAGAEDVFLIKTDSLGNVCWDTTYGAAGKDVGTCAHQTPDGGYIIAGYTASFSASQDVYLIRTDSLGSTVWERTYGGGDQDIGESVRQTSDGGYIIAGYTKSFGAGGEDLYLIKTDSLGNLLWDTTYGGPFPDRGYSVWQTLDGGYVITGYTGSFGSGMYNVYLVKTDDKGHVGAQDQDAEHEVRNPDMLDSRPNPFCGATTISYSLPSECEVTFKVYDTTGRLMETLVHQRQGRGEHHVRWNGKGYPSSIYFYRLEAGGIRRTGKSVAIR